MAALLYASRLPGCPYEIGLVASNDPEAEALTLAEAEGVATFALSHKGMKRAEHDAAMEQAALDASAQYIVLAGYMRILSPEFVRRWEGRMSISTRPCCPNIRVSTRMRGPLLQAIRMAERACIWSPKSSMRARYWARSK